MVGVRVEADAVGRGGVHLPRGVEQDVRNENVRVRVACESHEILTQQGIGASELREALLAGAFALDAHRLEQAFAMQCRTYQPGSDLQRRDDGGVELTYALPVVEANGADVFALDNQWNDCRGARLVAGDTDAVEATHRIGAEHHALARLQHRTVFIRERLVAFGELAAGVGQRLVDPLGLDLEQFLAVGTDTAKASAVLSTCAASPRSLRTSGMTFMASGDPSSKRLACAEAASNRSRCWRNWWLRMPSAAAAKSIGLMLMAG